MVFQKFWQHLSAATKQWHQLERVRIKNEKGKKSRIAHPQCLTIITVIFADTMRSLWLENEFCFGQIQSKAMSDRKRRKSISNKDVNSIPTINCTCSFLLVNVLHNENVCCRNFCAFILLPCGPRFPFIFFQTHAFSLDWQLNHPLYVVCCLKIQQKKTDIIWWCTLSK